MITISLSVDKDILLETFKLTLYMPTQRQRGGNRRNSRRGQGSRGQGSSRGRRSRSSNGRGRDSE
jgi:hypothetical protein